MTAGAQLKLDPVQDHSQHARRRRAGKGESPGHDNRIREQTSTGVKQQSREVQKADEVDLVAHSRAKFEGRKLSWQASVLVAVPRLRPPEHTGEYAGPPRPDQHR